MLHDPSVTITIQTEYYSVMCGAVLFYCMFAVYSELNRNKGLLETLDTYNYLGVFVSCPNAHLSWRSMWGHALYLDRMFLLIKETL